MKRMRKYLVSLLLTLALLSQVFVAYGEEETNLDEISSTTTEITILHTNDMHGRHAEKDKIQIGNVATLKKSIPNSVLVDAGDNLHGLPFVNISKGMDAVKLMKAAGYDYMAPGNHDFNYGQERLLELANAAKDNGGFEIMAANVLKNGNPILKPNDIKDINGIKVGFFGLASPETTYKTHPDNVKGLDFKNPVEIAKGQVQELKNNGAEVIVGITHVGMDASSNPTTINIANEVEGIDVIIDGHSHTVLDGGKEVNNTLIASAGEYLNNIGEVKITVDNATKKVTKKTARLIKKEEALTHTSDAAIDAQVNDIKEAQKPMLSEVVGKTSVVLDGERQNVRTKETNLGNLINDAVLDETGADIAINNGGNIRKTIQIGDITKGDIIDVLPFGNRTITKELTGEQVKRVLEHGVKDYPATSGGFTQVAGISYTFDPTLKVGERITKITKDGQPLDMNKKYIVATNDFLAVGGDDFPCFGDVPTINEYGGLEESVIKYIQKLGTVSPKVEGRIVVDTTNLENQNAANKVVDMINKLPEDIKLENKDLVVLARKAYNELSDKQKELVVNYEKLTAAETKIKELENNDVDKEAANKVIDMINNLSDKLTLKDKEKVEEIRKAYNGLSDKQKLLVTNYEKLVGAEKQIQTLVNTNEGNKPQPPKTGDIGIAVCLFGLVSSSAGLYVYNKRK